MTVTAFIVLGSSGLVCAICTMLVFHPEYDDDFVRRLGLAVIGLSAFMRAIGIIEHLHNGWESPRAFGHVAILAWVGMALFFSDHFYNFLRKSRASRLRKRRAEDKDAFQIQRQA